MISIVQWIIMGFGMALALAGLLLFVFRQEKGTNRVKLLGQEFVLSTPALVIFISGCAVVVIATLSLSEKKLAQEEIKGGTSSNQAIEKQAHEIRFLAKPVKMPRDECMTKGKEALNRSGFTGIDVADEVVYGYAQEYTGAIWCYSSNDLVIFIVSGPNLQTASIKLTNLERGF